MGSAKHEWLLLPVIGHSREGTVIEQQGLRHGPLAKLPINGVTQGNRWGIAMVLYVKHAHGVAEVKISAITASYVHFDDAHKPHIIP